MISRAASGWKKALISRETIVPKIVSDAIKIPSDFKFVFGNLFIITGPAAEKQSEIIVAKSRYGRIGTHQVGFNGGRCKFYMNDKLAKDDSK